MTQPVSAAPPATPWNVLAIVSLVSGILAIGLVAVITGHLGLRQIKRKGEQGRVLAIVGLILGYLWIALVLLGLIGWFIYFAFMGTVTTVGS